MSNSKITVLKFGGSVLRSKDDLPLAVHEIYKHWRQGRRVLAVVSAFKGVTDKLLDEGRGFAAEPPADAIAALLATGEAASASLLALALNQAGVPSKLLSPEQAAIRTAGNPLDSEPIGANTEKLLAELEKAVVIVSGFVGVNNCGDPTLLGRGGTDYSALFLAENLDADCILIKDVDGLYESDPNAGIDIYGRFASASYETVLRVGGDLVQAKALNFAQKHGLEFQISSLGSTSCTRVGDVEDRIEEFTGSSGRPMRVALLGCGTVGGGVYKRLAALPELFDVTGVVNRHPERAIKAGVSEHLIRQNAAALIDEGCDLVIELIGGIEPAREMIIHALRSGSHVISANKALFASDADFLEDRAEKAGVSIMYSAAVGGAMPALEAASRWSKTRKATRIRGIINGTCNFICDELAEGVSFVEALELAKHFGFAEADPATDLNGSDAAQKLILLARAAFGETLPFESIKRTGLDGTSISAATEAKQKGRTVRIVAECRITENGVEASVGPADLTDADILAGVRGADNCLIFETSDGNREIVRGRGAGRYATTESVMSDVFDVYAALTNSVSEQPIIHRPIPAAKYLSLGAAV